MSHKKRCKQGSKKGVGSVHHTKDRIISREHAKVVQNQRKFDTQFQAAQLSARQQIDKRIDENLAGLDAKVKSIIKETVKSQYIKKESIAYDKSLFEEESAYHGEQSQQASGFQRQSSSSSSKRHRQPEAIDLRSPQVSRKHKEENRPLHQHTQGVIPYFK